jgi:hypothetical protein
MAYRYDASRTALLTPGHKAGFFPAGRPPSEAALCAELSRLAYVPFERDAEARLAVVSALRRAGFERSLLLSAGGTQAFLAHDPHSGLSVLVFRGTELDPRDWATDLSVWPVAWPEGGLVHDGFAHALNAIWAQVTTALTESAGRLIYTGHSLGAALATLAASRHAPGAIYTFGSPRVGNDAFVRSIAALEHHRFVNCCDVVCRVPPETFEYHHAGPASYLDRRGALHLAPAEAVVERDQRRARRAYLWRWSWRPGTLWIRDLADHAPINYYRAVSQQH